MHILLRFYEVKGNRKEKTTTMLRTMGSSILIGGISTFLGTLPLAFASSEIFRTIFVTFLGIVTIGKPYAVLFCSVFHTFSSFNCLPRSLLFLCTFYFAGMGHALILVPVVLSTIGPEGQIA